MATKRVRSLFGLGGALSGLFAQPSIGELLVPSNPLAAATSSASDWEWRDVELEDFVNSLDNEYVGAGQTLLKHKNPTFESFYVSNDTKSSSVPPILMTKVVYDGFRRAKPEAKSITEKWYALRKVKVPGYTDEIYGGDVYYPIFKS